MRVLILGGTQFIGRHIAQTLHAAGHQLSVLNRGQSPDELPIEIERLRGDRDDGAAGLQAIAGRVFDVCVDVSGYTPRQVRPSAQALRESVKRYVYVSAVMAYGDPDERPVFETHRRLPPASEHVTEVNGETYGALKVACENIVREVFGERASLLRPQIVVGPQDPTTRYSYWVHRATQGGEMLAPGDGADHLQVIDVRDLARFTKTLIENDLSGAFNLAGPRLTWAEFLRMLGAQNLVWVDAQVIRDADLSFGELPLYRPERGPLSGLMEVSNQRACTAGLTLTEPEVTARDMRAWMRGREPPLALSPQREAQLIGIARKRPTPPR